MLPAGTAWCSFFAVTHCEFPCCLPCFPQLPDPLTHLPSACSRRLQSKLWRKPAVELSRDSAMEFVLEE